MHFTRIDIFISFIQKCSLAHCAPSAFVKAPIYLNEAPSTPARYGVPEQMVEQVGCQVVSKDCARELRSDICACCKHVLHTAKEASCFV